MPDFTRQVVLIIGISSPGLVRTIARNFGRRGAKVAICGINGEDIDDSVKGLLSMGYESIGFVANLSERESVGSLVDCIVKLYGRIDVLVNNADSSQADTAAHMGDRQLIINISDLPLITQTVCEVMKKQKYGRIVNIYSASKTTRLGLAKNLARRISQRGVNSYSVYPGLINTDIRVSTPQELSEVFITNITMGSFGKTQEISDAIMFLASKDASCMTDGTLMD